MLHFNQRNWFKFYPDSSAAAPIQDTPVFDGPPEGEELGVLPEPRNRKEFYLSLLAGHTPIKKKVLFSGYGEYTLAEINYNGRVSDIPTIEIPVFGTNEPVKVMFGNLECQYRESIREYVITTYSYTYIDSKIHIHVSSEADAANKVVIFKAIELTPPEPKTVTEFYLAKMAGVEVVDRFEKVLEQEFTFGTEPNNKGYYSARISNVYDEAVDVSHLIAHIDGIEDNSSFNVEIPGDGAVIVYTRDASYAGTAHTLELFYKTIIKDVPVKTRTEQYLKAIAANQDSSDSSEPSSEPGLAVDPLH